MGTPLTRARRTDRLRAAAVVEVTREGPVVVEARRPHLVPPSRRGSLSELPYRNAAEAPDAVVLSRRTAAGAWADVTAAAFAAEVSATAKGLISAGIAPGDRIALMARTCYEWTLLDFAAWACGAAVVPVYPTAAAGQAEWILRDSGAVAVVAEDAACAAVIAEALAAMRATGTAEPVLWLLDQGAVADLAGRGASVPDGELAHRRALQTPATEATVIYTSGTTGRPKGCPLTHGNFLDEAANCHALLHPVFEAVSDEPAATLLFLPLAHVLGRMIQVACVHARIRIGHSPSLKPAELRPDLAGFGATFLVGVPYLFEKIHQLGRVEAERRRAGRVYDNAVRAAVRYGRAELAALAGEGPRPPLRERAAHRMYDLLVYRKVRAALGGRVRYAISGGSSLAPELLLFFAGAGVLVYEGYGLTETTGPSTVNPPLGPRPGTVGQPVPGSAVRIAPDGEVLLSGGQVFAGYRGPGGRRDPAEGWFATGDLGRLDEDGYLTITGRKKEILVTSGGKNVSPAPMEDRLRAHPLIGQCLVVGDGRAYIGALVTLDAEAVGQHLAHLPSDARRTAPATTADDGRPNEQLSSAVPLHPAVLAAVGRAVAEVNSTVSRAESIRRVRIVAGDFTEERGLLTPSLKVRRQAVLAAYREDVALLYG
ncbi:AMP-dependent synthetase/ligase [Kitasatospora indigofera]|uniref:AMP-dependent synthetase/ligase n=1 Tax=Kitasatospora indigofera TaxID=67307 RepID=UPI003662ABC6